MSLSFPCDRSLDRGVGNQAERALLLATGTSSSEAGWGSSVGNPPAAVPVRPCRDSSEGAAPRPSPRPAAPSGDLSGLRCDPCVMGRCCEGLTRWCRCSCAHRAVAEGCAYYEDDEEFVRHEEDVILEDLRNEGAIPDYTAVSLSEYGSGSKQGWAL